MELLVRGAGEQAVLLPSGSLCRYNAVIIKRRVLFCAIVADFVRRVFLLHTDTHVNGFEDIYRMLQDLGGGDHVAERREWGIWPWEEVLRMHDAY